MSLSLFLYILLPSFWSKYIYFWSRDVMFFLQKVAYFIVKPYIELNFGFKTPLLFIYYYYFNSENFFFLGFHVDLFFCFALLHKKKKIRQHVHITKWFFFHLLLLKIKRTKKKFLSLSLSFYSHHLDIELFHTLNWLQL